MTQITNWDRWQTFRKDRGSPPWIKLHRNLLSNPEWVSLSDAEKGQLVSMWIVASERSGMLPDDPSIIKRVAMLDVAPNLTKFSELGFLTTTWQPSAEQVNVASCSKSDHVASMSSGNNNLQTMPTNIENHDRTEESRVEKSKETPIATSDDIAPEKPKRRAKRKPAKKALKWNEDRDFLVLKNAYPAREGANEWPKGYGCFKARKKEGHTVQEMLNGINRYFEFQMEKGKIGTEYVMQMPRFLGPSKNFLEQWVVSKPETREFIPKDDNEMIRWGTARGMPPRTGEEFPEYRHRLQGAAR